MTVVRAAVALVLALGCTTEEAVAPWRSLCPRSVIHAVNDRWIAEHADPGANTWPRAVYFIGDMAAYAALGEPAYRDHALAWAEGHGWAIHNGPDTRNADDFAAGQVYLALYAEDPEPRRIAAIAEVVDNVVGSGGVLAPPGGGDGEDDDWAWIDALFMASPVFAELGRISGDPRVARKMFDLYSDTKVRRGLYDPAEGLWYRDEAYVYPAVTSANGEKEFWARGNGWVIASLVRTLEHLPDDSPLRGEYVTMLQTMAAALAAVQRADGLWNVSLHDPKDFGGPETSGTALFTYAIAWGIRMGHLDAGVYGPVVEAAWSGMVTIAVGEDGSVGHVQGSARSPAGGQPVTGDKAADFGVGVFLLAASEVHMLGLYPDCE